MPPLPRPRRSALFLPASNPRALAKALTLPVDVVILDLEDAVAPDAKRAAREAAVAAVGTGGFGTRQIVVRVNGRDTEWFADDLAALADVSPDAILLPKVNGPEELDDLPGTMPLWAMIETCAAIPRLGAIAAHPRIACLVIGTNDLAKEMRARLTPDRAPFLPILTLAVAAARASGIAILDGVCNDFNDLARFGAECEQGRNFGFDGKTLIHPAQVEICNAAFSPGADDVIWAEAVVAAFALPENTARGAVKIDGHMVERLHLAEAERIRALVAQDVHQHRLTPQA